MGLSGSLMHAAMTKTGVHCTSRSPADSDSRSQKACTLPVAALSWPRCPQCLTRRRSVRRTAPASMFFWREASTALHERREHSERDAQDGHRVAAAGQKVFCMCGLHIKPAHMQSDYAR
jgi:hypothetical protein